MTRIDPSRPVGIGMIGTGFMARTHTACFGIDGRARLAHVASRHEASAREFANEHGYANASGDWRRLLADEAVDLIDIVSPNALHAEMAVATAEAGKHFILDKPIATNPEDARRIVDAANEAGVLGLYHENRRFAPVLLEAHRQVQNGAIGRLHLIRVNELGSGPSHATWFRDPALSGGGALIDLGVHGLYVLEWFAGEPIVEVQAVARWADDEALDETMCVSYRFASGAVAQTASSWAARGGIDLRTELFGDAGTLLLDQSRTIGGMRLYREEAGAADAATPHAAAGSGWSHPQVEPLRTRGSLGAMSHFLDCLLTDETPRCTVREGRRVVELADAIYRSARERRPMIVEASSDIVSVQEGNA